MATNFGLFNELLLTEQHSYKMLVVYIPLQYREHPCHADVQLFHMHGPFLRIRQAILPTYIVTTDRIFSNLDRFDQPLLNTRIMGPELVNSQMYGVI